MVSFSQQSGLPWDQAIEQRPAAGADHLGGHPTYSGSLRPIPAKG